MKSLSTICRLLSLFAILGLVLGPLAKPAMAMNMSASPAAVADHAGMAMAMNMSVSPAAVADHAGTAMDAASMGEMPCCPDEAPKSGCAKDCPLMALCMTTAFQNVSYPAGPVVFFTLGRAIFPVSTPQLEGLTSSPSPRPPNA